MTVWILEGVLILGLVFALLLRREELRTLARGRLEQRRAKERGSDRARLQYPHIDGTRCIGCGICVAACPEEGVLDVLHGQAVVVHGARCVGHGRCAVECPVGAIAVTLGDLQERRDIPVLGADFESPQVQGLYLAGEVTGFALVRTAIAHGSAVAREVARRKSDETSNSDMLDLCIVGAGPAGLACSLEAKRQGLSFVTIEQGSLGGTVSSYPRRKLVMTQPVELPLHGRLDQTTYLKEELIELWEEVAREHQLPIHAGVRMQEVQHHPRGGFTVRCTDGEVVAKNICLALGRRGTPRKLGVPGEDLPKVAYSLLDAQSYNHRRILVVGGGDSAVEAAIGLSEQAGNRVSLSYRGAAFSRIKARNELRLLRAIEEQKLDVLYESHVLAIEADQVRLSQDIGGLERVHQLPNDDVFIFAGGIPPFDLLQDAGVSFDPRDREEAPPIADQGSGLLPALVTALGLILVSVAWLVFHFDYYGAELTERVRLAVHQQLRPAGATGLGFGIGASLLVLTNLAYLLRRHLRFPLYFGSLQRWMTVHLVTGLMALILTLLHCGMTLRDTTGGHAALALVVLVVTGTIGRYFYSFVPRAANGRELALEDVRLELAQLASGWERNNRNFGDRVRKQVDALISTGEWEGGFASRLKSLLTSQGQLSRLIQRFRSEGKAEGIPREQLVELETLARRAHRTALMASHYEELRGLLSSWRYLHRWVALLMVLLVIAHIVVALRYASFG